MATGIVRSCRRRSRSGSVGLDGGISDLLHAVARSRRAAASSVPAGAQVSDVAEQVPGGRAAASVQLV